MKEICTIEIDKSLLEKLSDNDIIKCGEDYYIKKVDVLDFDYSIYPEWVAQKKLSNKTYKKLKEIEYKIRHK